MVVVPTSHTVTLHYARIGPEIAGIALSVLGLVGLVGLVIWRPRDPGRGRAGAGPTRRRGPGRRDRQATRQIPRRSR